MLHDVHRPHPARLGRQLVRPRRGSPARSAALLRRPRPARHHRPVLDRRRLRDDRQHRDRRRHDHAADARHRDASPARRCRGSCWPRARCGWASTATPCSPPSPRGASRCSRSPPRSPRSPPPIGCGPAAGLLRLPLVRARAARDPRRRRAADRHAPGVRCRGRSAALRSSRRCSRSAASRGGRPIRCCGSATTTAYASDPALLVLGVGQPRRLDLHRRARGLGRLPRPPGAACVRTCSPSSPPQRC